MKSLLLILASIILTTLFTGCPPTKTEYYNGVFPTIPVNFTEINSVYDDYNSALPVIWHNQYLSFSSNRNSAGQNFDVVGDNLNIWWDMETGELTINNSIHSYDISFIDTLQQMINTPANEFGPYSLNYWLPSGMEESTQYNLISYSSNFESEYYKSKFVYYESDGYGNGDGNYFGPYDIHLINSLQDPQYISFLREAEYNAQYWEIDPTQYNKMIFNSNIDESTNIYSINLPPNNNFINMLKSDTAVAPISITELNSEYEDKCPFVNEHLIVFSSNRPGGFGGYDLYYSRFNNDGSWSEPVNFGADINTSYDEFRPVTIIAHEFVNDLMIFSSNRPGGKGGFDLYYVGMPFKIQEHILITH